MLFGWMAAGRRDAPAIAHAMAHALRVHHRQRWQIAEAPGSLAIGVMVNDAADADVDRCAPAVSADRRFWLWMAGEAYDGGTLCAVRSAAFSRTLTFRRALLDALSRRGCDAIAELDGRYQIALYDALERRLTLGIDRFGGLQAFWAQTPEGTAFAGGVRGVVMAPAVGHAPDADAVREAVTFGGFRLGARTNVRGVERLRGGSLLSVEAGRAATRDYWRWPSAPATSPAVSRDDLFSRASELWRRAIAVRLADARRPGQTLSGGLDSRAILAEAAPHAPSWTAITYGIDRCDDARYARQAAEAAGAAWLFAPLYQGAAPDWLERRTALIHETDGLVQLADLLHCESLPLQASHLDVHLSGYIGDVVCGTTYDGVVDARTLWAKLPFSGVAIGWSGEQALEWCADAIGAIAPSQPRYAIYEHKFPQAIHLIFQSYSPYLHVRTPFTDYALFDFFAALPETTRAWLYPAWLARTYPRLFAAIPDQRTGLPPAASRARIAVERGRRGAARALSSALGAVGLRPPAPRVRGYQDEHRQWTRPDVRARIEGALTGPGSLVGDIFDRTALRSVLSEFFDRGQGPVQFVGALYVFEIYHRELASRLRAAAQAADAEAPCALATT